jgi:hypothetical protein
MRTLLALTVCCLALPGCRAVGASRDEVARVRSPSGRLDAILVETNGGPGTDFGYFVYVVESGRRAPRSGAVAWLYGALRNRRAYGANLRWDAASSLGIEYLDAHQVERRRSQVVVGPDTVSVSLRPGVADSLAPPGGMLYNLRRGRRSGVRRAAVRDDALGVRAVLTLASRHTRPANTRRREGSR